MRRPSSTRVVVVGGPFRQKIDPVLQLVPTGKGLLAAEIADALEQHFLTVVRIGNFPGGEECSFEELQERMVSLEVNVVVFLPHLPNIIVQESSEKIRADEGQTGFIEYSRAPKIVESIKELHPEVLLVPFKLADKEADRLDIVRWMLQIRSALAVYSRLGDVGRYFIFDALGNEMLATRAALPGMLAESILHFSKAIRRRSVRIGEEVPDVEHVDVLVAFSQRMQPAFESIIGAGNVMTERWPGNFSFRCTYGFLSYRVGEGFIITKRNVDKTGLTEEDFVFVSLELKDGKIKFWGKEPQKPSIDAPIHRVLYSELPWVQCIVHGHLQVVGECVYPETMSRWPCGAENEGFEIVEAISQCPPEELLVINVEGHGFVALIRDTNPAKALNKLSGLTFKTW